MPLTRIQLENFTAFRELDIELGPGIHAILGANGTGKTHLLKLGYAAVSIENLANAQDQSHAVNRFDRLFLGGKTDWPAPVVHRYGDHEGRKPKAIANIFAESYKLGISVTLREGLTPPMVSTTSTGTTPLEGTFIPAKEMLVNAPGFRSLYEAREVHFDATYVEIIDRAFRPPLRQIDPPRQQLLDRLEEVMGGAVDQRGETFFLEAPYGALPFDLVGEGLHKIALLWLLIKNGTIGREGTVLFWDEPEANLNPGLMRVVVEVLLGLQRLGTQILVATHDYALLKELDLQSDADDPVRFHVLYRDEAGDVRHSAENEIALLEENPISAAYGDLLNRDLRRALERNEA